MATGATPRRLLVLDDDELVGMLVETIARMAGFSTRLTAEPASFLSEALAWQPDLIFLDLTLPSMPGEEVLRQLGGQRCTARIVVSSGVEPARLADAAALARQCGLSVAGTLAKPFLPAALRALLG